MPIEVTMPKFGLTMHEGTLQRYFKAAGDTVKAGEPIYEVETEKVLYEVESPSAGILAIWLHPEGATVEFEPQQGEKGPQAANVVVVA